MTIESVNPLAVKQEMAKASKTKSSGEFGSVLMDAITGAEAASSTAVGMYGGVNSQAVLTAAFSGVNAYNSQAGGSTPYMSSSMGGGTHLASTDMSALMGGPGAGGDAYGDAANTPVVAGTSGYSQADLINQMNQNSLTLLTLQAKLQVGMQDANTKSNILSADHKAKMAVIEKFAARG